MNKNKFLLIILFFIGSFVFWSYLKADDFKTPVTDEEWSQFIEEGKESQKEEAKKKLEEERYQSLFVTNALHTGLNRWCFFLGSSLKSISDDLNTRKADISISEVQQKSVIADLALKHCKWLLDDRDK